MGYIEVKKLKNGIRFKAEVKLKGHSNLTEVFDWKTDAKTWISQVEADIRAGRNNLNTVSGKPPHLEVNSFSSYESRSSLSLLAG
jgi:hypothetical protein